MKQQGLLAAREGEGAAAGAVAACGSGMGNETQSIESQVD